MSKVSRTSIPMTSRSSGAATSRPSGSMVTSRAKKIRRASRSSSSNEPDLTHMMKSMAATYQTNELARWISSHLNMRQCIKFTPKNNDAFSTKDEVTLCRCGYPKSVHCEDALSNENPSDPEWQDTKWTVPVPTNAFGQMEFVNHGGRTSQYVRVDDQALMHRMIYLLTGKWKLPRPKLLISVTGGAKDFTMRPRLKDVFRRGLVRAAESTDAWIITGGTHAGVMKHVGEAVRDYKTAHGSQNSVVAIGLASWGVVSNKEELINRYDPQKGCWPASYRTGQQTQGNECDLDPNHSHFILVDNGTQHKFAVEIAFRASLESTISKSLSGSRDIPIVCLVLEGGPGTLETVMSAIQNGTPAVIVEGSGRAADILAYAYANSQEQEISAVDSVGREHKGVIAVFDDDLWIDIRQQVKAAWGDKCLDLWVSWIQQCIQKRNYMSVFRLDAADSAKDIDVAILQALLKVNKSDKLSQLRLALTWNSLDVAVSLFGEAEENQFDAVSLGEVMHTALVEDKVEFVKLFIDNGLSLRTFITPWRLLKLYNDIPKNSLLYKILYKRKDVNRPDFNYEDICHVIKSLMGDFYSTSDYLDKYRDVQLTSKTSEKDHVPLKEPTRDLFLWSVLLNRIEMGKFFWEEGKEGLGAALTAHKLLKSMEKKTEDYEVVKELKSQANYYEGLSVGVLSECHTADDIRAQQLLIRVMPGFGYSTNVTLAVQGDNKQFIAHAACQNLLTSVWHGSMLPDNSFARIWLCILFPPFIFCLIHWHQKQNDTEDGADKKAEMTSYRYQRESTMPAGVDDPAAMTPHVETGTPTKATPARITSRPGLTRRTTKWQKPLQDTARAKSTGYNFFEKFILFFNAPVTIFLVNVVFYLVFLCLFSYILLSDFHPAIGWKEIVLYVWAFTLFLEEGRETTNDQFRHLRLNLLTYLNDSWNVIDILALLFFLTGVALRSIPDCDGCFTAARIVLAVDLMVFIFRALHIFSIHKQLGPKLVMIARMMRDMAFFVIILMVFIIAYGVAAWALLYPNSDLEPILFRNVVRMSYWQMYGELFLEQIEGDLAEPCTDSIEDHRVNGTARCPEAVATEVVPILLGIYILLTNVLMLNLLIAMFSYTFDRVQRQTDLHWNFQRYALIKKYHDRPPLPPPLILFNHLFLVCCCLTGFCRKTPVDNDDRFRRRYRDRAEEKQLILWENLHADEYMRRVESQSRQNTDTRVKTTTEQVEGIMHRIEEISDSSMMNAVVPADSSQVRLPPALADRIFYLEAQQRRTAKALDWIIQSLVEKGTNKKPPELQDVDQLREIARQKRQEEAMKKKQEFIELLKRQLEQHVKARIRNYPCSSMESEKQVYRVPVSDDMVHWDIEWLDYVPTCFTDTRIKSDRPYADHDLIVLTPSERNIKFNTYDDTMQIDRRSMNGEKYDVIDGLPLNPQGRTGMCGRGKLGRWGPNHAGDPIVTRWARDPQGQVMKNEGKPVLEFIAIYREYDSEWAIPGGFQMPGQAVHENLRAEFDEEALGQEEGESPADLKIQLDQLFKNGKKVYRGYVDDPRNTDNAWIESIVMNYHDDNGSVLKHANLKTPEQINIKAGGDAALVRWQQITSREQLYSVHLSFLQKVADLHGASF